MQNKKQFFMLAGAIIILSGAFFWYTSYRNQPRPTASYREVQFIVDGKTIQLIPNSPDHKRFVSGGEKLVASYFGNEVHKDLNGDGEKDVAFLVTTQPGGSGTFYYAVAAIKTAEGYVGSQAFFIGDRIAPQNIESGQAQSIIVNYADRKPEEPYTAAPSIGKSLRLMFDAQQMEFVPVEDFEGEADPARMNLQMTDWVWQRAEYTNGTVLVPKQIGAFTISFASDGRFSAGTDCNRISGQYTAGTSSIRFSNMAMTLMFCQDSQESDFAKVLESARSYHFTSRGELILDLGSQAGTAVFR